MSESWFDDLWIGDVLRRVSTGKYGKYEGISESGKILWYAGGTQQLVSADDIERRVYDEAQLLQEALIKREGPAAVTIPAQKSSSPAKPRSNREPRRNPVPEEKSSVEEVPGTVNAKRPVKFGPRVASQTDATISDEIDLHLGPDDEKKLGNWPGSELHYQITQCRKYLTRAQEAGLKEVRIIHGKGAGVLRAEVHQLMAEHASVERWAIIDAGATRVWLVPS